MIVSPEIQKRMDTLWASLQDILRDTNDGISQIDLDIKCMITLETIVNNFIDETEDKITGDDPFDDDFED